MPWRRQSRTNETRRSSGSIDHRDAELRLDAHIGGGADGLQKLERVGVAAEQHMLAVVDQLAGFSIGKSRGAAAKPTTRFHDQDARTVPSQPDGRTQSGESRADDDDIVSAYGHSHCFTAISACLGRGTRARAVNTSYPLRSMRSRVSK